MAINWKRSDKIVWEEMDGQALLVDAESGARWSLNAAAASIWALCDGSRSLLELALAFARASGRSGVEIQRETAKFCETFARLGLLQPNGDIIGDIIPAPAGWGNLVVSRTGGWSSPIGFRSLGVGGNGPRHRASPRGNSGPG